MAETVSFRAEDGTTELAIELMELLSKLPAYQGLGFTRSRVYAMALARGLAVLKAEASSQRKPSKTKR
jgi:hypothetical protein